MNNVYSISGLEVTVKKEILEGIALLHVSMSRKAFKTFKTTTAIPIISEDRSHIVVNRNVYSNLIYAVPPWGSDEVPCIGGFLANVEGLRSNDYRLMAPQGKSFNPITAVVPPYHGNIYNLDTWCYVRASDLMEAAIAEGIRRTVNGVARYGNPGLHIRGVVRKSMMLFRYMGFEKLVPKWKIRDESRRVILPRVFDISSDELSILKCSFLDLSDANQNLVFESFSLKKGVVLDEIETNRTLSSILGAKIRQAVPEMDGSKT